MSSPINAAQLVRMGVFGAGVPREGPKCLPVSLDFTSAGQWEIDLSTLQNQNVIAEVQTVWIDNSGSDVPMSIFVPGTQQNLICKARSQGYFPILCPNPARLLVTSGTGQPMGTSGIVQQISLLNYPANTGQWSTQ